MLAQQQAQARAAALQARQAAAGTQGRASTEDTKTGALGVSQAPLGNAANTIY